MANRPSIKSPCVADHYHAPGERIAEISGTGGVCLLSVREYTRDDGRSGLLLDVYAADETVMVRWAAQPTAPVEEPAQPTAPADVNADLSELVKAVLLWASTPGDHGGNPYLKPFVMLARKIAGDE